MHHTRYEGTPKKPAVGHSSSKTSAALAVRVRTLDQTELGWENLMSPLLYCDLSMLISVMGTLWSERPRRGNAQAHT